MVWVEKSVKSMGCQLSKWGLHSGRDTAEKILKIEGVATNSFRMRLDTTRCTGQLREMGLKKNPVSKRVRHPPSGIHSLVFSLEIFC